ncbi:YeiH family protein [Clostridium cylindrosporum]|uniref:Uncharacterized protein n=1 Tax=Clostridium cylindrosporum DSM 605 TaxID=1121307 RepID=A0A0J8DGI1_CLOCY|nr:putative sulfate exporter family transporter [Clostridium cylindrosporum]KMT23334.1 hypothetical protein CLCY_8c00710 [Clostridium cylindrosporum DSM 605]
MNHKYIRSNFLSIIPGFLACFTIAFISNYLAKFLPTLGTSIIAIFLGIIFGNTILNKNIFDKGTKFSEGTLLSISVVLLGSTLNINSILTIGTKGVFYIAIQMIVTISAAIWIGRKMKFSDNFTLLMASGNGVCGSSAIASTAPAIEASNLDKGISITLVNITGTVLMLLLPIFAYFIFNLDIYRTSALIGGTLQSVGQVVASGKMISPVVSELSTIFKIVRIIFLVFVVMYISWFKNKSTKSNSLDNCDTTTKNKLQIKIPWYVIGFFITCTLFTLGVISNNLSNVLKSISCNFEVIALAGIGMRVKLSELILHGFRYSIYAALIGLVQVISALILIIIIL